MRYVRFIIIFPPGIRRRIDEPHFSFFRYFGLQIDLLDTGPSILLIATVSLSQLLLFFRLYWYPDFLF